MRRVVRCAFGRLQHHGRAAGAAGARGASTACMARPRLCIYVDRGGARRPSARLTRFDVWSGSGWLRGSCAHSGGSCAAWHPQHVVSAGSGIELLATWKQPSGARAVLPLGWTQRLAWGASATVGSRTVACCLKKPSLTYRVVFDTAAFSFTPHTTMAAHGSLLFADHVIAAGHAVRARPRPDSVGIPEPTCEHDAGAQPCWCWNCPWHSACMLISLGPSPPDLNQRDEHAGRVDRVASSLWVRRTRSDRRDRSQVRLLDRGGVDPLRVLQKQWCEHQRDDQPCLISAYMSISLVVFLQGVSRADRRARRGR